MLSHAQSKKCLVLGFLEKDGKPYCCRDFYQLFAPKCSGCGESVKENYLTAANGTWHPECFVCAVSPFTSDLTRGSESHTSRRMNGRDTRTFALFATFCPQG